MKATVSTESQKDKSSIDNSKFVYVTYIRTSQEKLWDALTKPEFTKIYWGGTWQESDWKTGSSWQLMFSDGRSADNGIIEEIEKPKRLVLTWRNETMPELKAEGYSRCTFDLEPIDNTVKLTITHEIDYPKSKFIARVSNGWPLILASLKSLLETGKHLEVNFPCSKET
jgi:uncharacterized protein YndB with AHSA1/START domain